MLEKKRLWIAISLLFFQTYVCLNKSTPHLQSIFANQTPPCLIKSLTYFLLLYGVDTMELQKIIVNGLVGKQEAHLQFEFVLWADKRAKAETQMWTLNKIK